MRPQTDFKWAAALTAASFIAILLARYSDAELHLGFTKNLKSTSTQIPKKWWLHELKHRLNHSKRQAEPQCKVQFINLATTTEDGIKDGFEDVLSVLNVSWEQNIELSTLSHISSGVYSCNSNMLVDKISLVSDPEDSIISAPFHGYWEGLDQEPLWKLLLLF